MRENEKTEGDGEREIFVRLGQMFLERQPGLRDRLR